MKLSSIAGALALATVFALTAPVALAEEAPPFGDDTIGDTQASPEPEGPEGLPGQWASATATVKTSATKECKHSALHREADGCTPGSCNSAKAAVLAAMKQVLPNSTCYQYIVVKSTCQFGPGCKK